MKKAYLAGELSDPDITTESVMQILSMVNQALSLSTIVVHSNGIDLYFQIRSAIEIDGADIPGIHHRLQ